MFERGVTWYVRVPLQYQINYPEGYICCYYCPLFNPHDDRCKITGEPILRPKRTIGEKCPADFELMEEDAHE